MTGGRWSAPRLHRSTTTCDRRRRRGVRVHEALLHHLLGNAEADREFSSSAADAASTRGHALAHLALHVVVEITYGRHARPLVDTRPPLSPDLI